MLYLYQSEAAGSDFISVEAPTLHDIKCVKVGVLNVYRFDENSILILNQDGSWEPVETGKLFDPPAELKELGPYHGPKDLEG